MFFVLPVWPRVRSFPAATAALVFLNVAVFSVAWPLELSRSSSVSGDHRVEAARELCRILRGESALPPADRDLAAADAGTGFPTEGHDHLFRRWAERTNLLSARARYEWDSAYPLYASYAASLEKNPDGGGVFQKWGFKRGRFLPQVLTHQFLHAGFWHLFFNVLFLWAVGGLVESTGAATLVAVYVLGGIAAAYGQALWGLPDNAILVGASGAVSAVMGFGLGAVPSARTRVVYLAAPVLSVRYGTFHAPLWFFLPLWAFQQAVYGLVTRPYGNVTVGYGAHLAGFASGLLAAFLLRLLGRMPPAPASPAD